MSLFGGPSIDSNAISVSPVVSCFNLADFDSLQSRRSREILSCAFLMCVCVCAYTSLFEKERGTERWKETALASQCSWMWNNLLGFRIVDKAVCSAALQQHLHPSQRRRITVRVSDDPNFFESRTTNCHAKVPTRYQMWFWGDKARWWQFLRPRKLP